MNHTLMRNLATITLLFGALACAALATPAAARQKAEPRVIEITAKRYIFEPSVIEVTQGEPVRLVIKSLDGLHGFSVKKFKIDNEVLIGKDVTVDFVPKDAGEFPIMCTVICGEGHAQMTGTLKVVAKS